MIIGQNVLALFEIAVGYGLLCVWLPSVCLRTFVKDKPLTYRFFFYQVCANMYLILWGFVLAFCKCFNTLTLWLTLVVLPLGITAWRNKQAVAARLASMKETAQTIFTGMYGRRTLARDIRQGVWRQVKRLYGKYVRGHAGEWLGLCLIFLTVLYLFGQYHLTHESFAYGDENVHFYWEKELLHGNPFPVGMYPHGMHFLAAALSGMFGFPLSRVTLIIGLFNVCLLFSTLYLTLKGTFSSKTAVLFGIGFFLLTDIFSYFAYWRYQAALPMEMGLIPYCTMFYSMQHYISSRNKRDLLMFILSVGWCIHIHFYAAILAVFSCIAFAIIFLLPMLRRKIFHWFIIGGIIGGILGCAPFGVGLALGYPFEQSMGWAVSVIEEGTEQESIGMLQRSTDDDADATRIDLKNISVKNTLDSVLEVVKSPTALKLLLGLDALMLCIGLIGAISRKKRMRCLMMAFWGLTWLFGLGASTGVMPLMEVKRFSVFFGFLAVPLFVVPIQLLYTLAVWLRARSQIVETGLAAMMLAFFFFMVRDGYVKTDFTVETGLISEGDMKTCQRLMEEYPPNTWTVISTTYDLNLVRYYGYHYEIIDLLKTLDAHNGSLDIASNDEHLYVPSKDVFVVVETKIDQYDEVNFRRNSHSHAYDFENRGDPTPELALTDLPNTNLLENVKIYYYPWRKVVMSKLYYWMEKVKETYPDEVSVFYQDELVTVYHISQDEYFPLDLMLDYQSDLR